ncbi:MAG: hypothetical protein JRH11_09040 [Deltaproteobacteria bacterium]|nr:hypothetical protein [Deltaproteobacteria bacterium]
MGAPNLRLWLALLVAGSSLFWTEYVHAQTTRCVREAGDHCWQCADLPEGYLSTVSGGRGLPL